MPKNGLDKVIDYLRNIALRQEAAGMTDRQLLEGFIAARDEIAFAILVRRYAPLVWNVCRRVLTNHHDAEDAFQATFLVLVRKAASIANRDLLANWLYGVAHRTALKAKAATGKRQSREKQVAEMPEPTAVHDDLWSKMLPVLDQELSCLPDKYRACIVLCDLQGKTRKDVARLLRVPEGTVGSRLARARAMLAKRLRRHGLAVSGGTLAAVVSGNAESACVPVTVVWSTIKAATVLAAGQTVAGVISTQVAGLTEAVVRAMFMSNMKIAMGAMLVAVSVTALGGGLFAYGLAADEQGDPNEAAGQQTGRVAQQPPKKDKSDGPQSNSLQKEKPTEHNQKQSSRQELLNLLDKTIELKPLLDGQMMSLKECLGLLADISKFNFVKELPIQVDAEAFRAENPKAADVYDSRVQFPELPNRMTIADALRFVLSKVNTKNATFVVKPDHILITTYEMTSPTQKLNEKVRGIFEKRPLGSVLRELSEVLGTSIVVDNRAGDKVNTEVSAAFFNDIDLAGALRALTEMADLKVLVLDGTIYVTTQAHAEALRNEKNAQLAAQRKLALHADPLWPYRPEARGPTEVGGDQATGGSTNNPEGRLQEKVQGTFEKRPLGAVLKHLSEMYGTTIILDPRVGEKAKGEVSVVFRSDVSLWGAVRILTEMAELKAVVVDGAVFVTTPAHAEALRHAKDGREETQKPQKSG
jgi:RNA polymerase sigma factor (sigma-70 family)